MCLILDIFGTILWTGSRVYKRKKWSDITEILEAYIILLNKKTFKELMLVFLAFGCLLFAPRQS